MEEDYDYEPKYSDTKALSLIRKYCAYQERSHVEVRNRLRAWGFKGMDVEQIISQVITEGFLNEERFAQAYSGGKFRTKGWGGIKLRIELRNKGVTDKMIDKEVKKIIESDDYINKLKSILTKYQERVQKGTKKLTDREIKDKTIKYCLSKGYEMDTILKVINDKS